MAMIVFHHLAYHGDFDWQSSGITFPHLWYNLILMGGKVGVYVYVLISGYFLIDSDHSMISFKKVLKFWGQVFFYSIGLYLVLGACGISDFGMKSLIKALFPIIFSQWWFASAYFVLYIIHPFLNMALKNLDKRAYQLLVLTLIILWFVIPTFTTSYFESNRFIYFIVMYVIAGYARIHGFNSRFTSKHYIVFAMIVSLLTYASSIVFTLLGRRWAFFSAHSTYFYWEGKITVLLIAVSIFMAFAGLKLEYHKWINTIASATFGVYLIHENNIIRPLLWRGLFKNVWHQDGVDLILYSVLAVAAVYVVCTAIDLIRKYFIEKPFLMLTNKYADVLQERFSRIVWSVGKAIFGD